MAKLLQIILELFLCSTTLAKVPETKECTISLAEAKTMNSIFKNMVCSFLFSSQLEPDRLPFVSSRGQEMRPNHFKEDTESNVYT